jgi:Transposase DDE domain/Transposase domain (DUF772)
MLNIDGIGADAMIHTRDHQTPYLFDPWDYLGPKRKMLLSESWAGLFREHILAALPVHKLARSFTEDFGRPTKELYAALGSLLLQQMHDLTDEETVSQYSFNIQWHYALDIPGESDESKYLSPKTLWRLRHLVMKEKLDVELFNQTTETLAKAFHVDTNKQRLDSVHIRSNMRRLGRIGIFSKSIHTFLINLKRRHSEIFETIEKELVDRYLTEKAMSCFSLVKPSESGKTLERVARDLFALVRRFRVHEEVKSLHSYNTLLRVLKDQCSVTEEKDDQPAAVEVKPPKAVCSDSLQNPSDPDAGYSGHKGQGYQAQVMETYCDSDDESIRAKTLNLITHVEIESACLGDVHALIPALNSTKQRELAPAELLADSLYGSDDNCERAKEIGVDVISPAMGMPKENTLNLSDFQQSEKGIITACPQGHAPVKIRTGKKQKHGVAFSSEHCNVCPCKDQCPVKAGKKNHYLHYDLKTMRIANRRAMEHSPEFKDKYRWRSGIEATFSEMDKKTGVKRLRVRGLSAVSYFARLKAIAVNIFRATAVRKALALPGEAFAATKSDIRYAIFVFKEQFFKPMGLLASIFAPAAEQPRYELKIAA